MACIDIFLISLILVAAINFVQCSNHPNDSIMVVENTNGFVSMNLSINLQIMINNTYPPYPPQRKHIIGNRVSGKVAEAYI